MNEIYQILSGSLGAEEQLAQITNNLANVNTVGFKKDGAVFEAYLQAAAGGALIPSGAGESANPADSVWPTLNTYYTDFSQGTLQRTGHDLDVAIEGDAFFMVAGPEGEPHYTRAGNFQITGEGRLTTPTGRSVLDVAGRPIELDLTRGTVTITPEGAIHVGAEREPAAHLGLVRFESNGRLIKYGEGLFEAPDDMPARPVGPGEAPLRPGMVEGANVNPIEEMIRLIQLHRAYQAQQKAMESASDVTQQRIQAASQ